MKKIHENKGITGVETAVAIVIFMIFISVISVIFTNVYLSYTDNKRNAEATAYATQIIEMVEKMYYADVTKNNLAQKVMAMNIPKGYDISLQVNNYQNEEGPQLDLVKNVIVSVKYAVGKQTKTVEFKTIKAKEILITPNKPILEDNMVPVKYVIKNRETNEAYIEIANEDDPLWYSYENQRWANVAMIEGLEVEGGTKVTKENRKNLVGKKVTAKGEMYVWIPKYAYKGSDIIFIYSTSNSFVNGNGNLENISTKQGYVMHNAFEGKKGTWTKKYDNTTLAENALNNPADDNLNATKILVNSQYGNISNLAK